MKENWTLVGYILAIAVLLILYGFFIRWQFNLCYPEVSDSVAYCIQHAIP